MYATLSYDVTAGSTAIDEVRRMMLDVFPGREPVARRGVWRCGRSAAELRLQILTDAPSGIPPVITQVEGACFPQGWGGAGLFLRVYHGQDYYNLGFTEKITRLQFGVTLQRDQFLSFRIKPL